MTASCNTVELCYNGLSYIGCPVIGCCSVRSRVMHYGIGWYWIERTTFYRPTKYVVTNVPMYLQVLFEVLNNFLGLLFLQQDKHNSFQWEMTGCVFSTGFWNWIFWASICRI